MKKHQTRAAASDGREIHALDFAKEVKRRHKANKQAKKSRKGNRSNK